MLEGRWQSFLLPRHPHPASLHHLTAAKVALDPELFLRLANSSLCVKLTRVNFREFHIDMSSHIPSLAQFRSLFTSTLKTMEHSPIQQHQVE